MIPEEYMDQLKVGLKSFTDEEQAQILAEIESHIESADRDPQGEQDPQERQRSLMRELGSPQDLARGFRSVYRPGGWIDYLLVIVPEFILFPLLGFLFTAPDLPGAAPSGEWPYNYWLTGRAIVVLSALLALAGIRRRSLGLLLFWLPVTAADIVSLMTREQRWQVFPAEVRGSPFESLVWYVLLLLTVGWLVRVLWKQRADLLLLTFALQPLLLAGANYATVLIHERTNLAVNFPYWALGPISLFKGIELAWPALFFIGKSRRLRWLGVGLSAANLGVYNAMAGWKSPLIVVIWALFLGVVALGWSLDEHGRRPARAH